MPGGALEMYMNSRFPLVDRSHSLSHMFAEVNLCQHSKFIRCYFYYYPIFSQALCYMLFGDLYTPRQISTSAICSLVYSRRIIRYAHCTESRSLRLIIFRSRQFPVAFQGHALAERTKTLKSRRKVFLPWNPC